MHRETVSTQHLHTGIGALAVQSDRCSTKDAAAVLATGNQNINFTAAIATTRYSSESGSPTFNTSFAR